MLAQYHAAKKDQGSGLLARSPNDYNLSNFSWCPFTSIFHYDQSVEIESN